MASGATNGSIFTLGTNTAAHSATNETLRDIRDPVAIGPNWFWIGVAILAIVTALLALWAWKAWQKRKNTLGGSQLSPEEYARRRLREMLAWIHDPKLFVTGVSEAAREYLEARFGLKAPDRTTEEFLAELSNSIALDQRHKELLEGFLSRADLVKFAKYEPSRYELEDLHNAALRLVDETSMPRPAEVPQKNVPLPKELAAASPSPEPGSTDVPPLLLQGDERYMPRDHIAKGLKETTE